MRRLSLILICLLFTSALPIQAASNIPQPPLSRHQGIPELPPCDQQDTVPCEVTDYEYDIAILDEHAAETMWRDGDLFIFAHEATADGVVLMGDVPTGLRPIPNSDWFAIAVQIPRGDEALLNYGFLKIEGQSLVWGDLVYYDWRGPSAPAEPEAVEELAGTLEEFEIESENLDAPRQVTVYLPPEYDDSLQYPVVYLLDGAVVRSYSHVVEPAILNGDLTPLIMVGIHSHAPDPNRQLNYRGLEYLPILQTPPQRFIEHQIFITQDLIPAIEERYAVSTDREQRALFGLSDGATFTAWTVQDYPEIFGNALIFSLGTNPEFRETEDPIRYYMVYGTLELNFYMATSLWIEFVKDANLDYAYQERVSGHNLKLWQEEITDALIWVYGNGSE